MVVEARPWSHTLSKQPNVDLSNVTAEHSLGKGAVVQRKRGRPKKQTEASLGGSKGDVLTLPELTKRRLSDMCDDLGRLGKSSDVEQKRRRLGEVLTLQELLTEGVGWFTIKPTVTIVALGRRRYSYHRCVDCWKKGSRTQKEKIVALITLKQRQQKTTACEFFYAKETLTCGLLLSTRSPRQFWALLSNSSALSTTVEGRELPGE